MSVRDLPVLKAELLQILAELSRERFFVEFNCYFSCHLLQTAVALYNLGVSKEKFSAIIENYVLQLEGPDGRTRRMQDDNNESASGLAGVDEITVREADENEEEYGNTLLNVPIEDLKGKIPVQEVFSKKVIF